MFYGSSHYKAEQELWRDWMRKAYGAALVSTDPSTQNGAILVHPRTNHLIAASYNGFPYGVEETPERWQRPDKYGFVECAERSVIYLAAERGERTSGLTMVCPWAACCDCARAIICSGIKKLITYRPAFDRSPERWLSNVQRALQIMQEAGVEVEWLDGPLGLDFSIRMNGEEFRP